MVTNLAHTAIESTEPNNQSTVYVAVDIQSKSVAHDPSEQAETDFWGHEFATTLEAEIRNCLAHERIDTKAIEVRYISDPNAVPRDIVTGPSDVIDRVNDHVNQAIEYTWVLLLGPKGRTRIGAEAA